MDKMLTVDLLATAGEPADGVEVLWQEAESLVWADKSDTLRADLGLLGDVSIEAR